MMLECWASIAVKLGISEDDAALLHAFNRDWTSTWGRRKTYAVVSGIVERFGLDDKEFDRTYGVQLLARGILTAAEAQLFSTGRYNGMAQGQTKETEAGSGDGTPTIATASSDGNS